MAHHSATLMRAVSMCIRHLRAKQPHDTFQLQRYHVIVIKMNRYNRIVMFAPNVDSISPTTPKQRIYNR
jgi:hypothetical protein